MGRLDLTVVVGRRVGVLYCIEVAVVSEAYLRDGGSVEGEVAIPIGHPAAGKRTEDAEGGV